jgi:hypothetical protein
MLLLQLLLLLLHVLQLVVRCLLKSLLLLTTLSVAVLHMGFSTHSNKTASTLLLSLKATP